MFKKIKDFLKVFGVHKLYGFLKIFFYESLMPRLLACKVEICFYLKQHLAPVHVEKSNLNADLIISLTSYPPRFETLHLTLKSLLLQNLEFNQLVLWIAEKDKDLLPESILNLKSEGLVIKFCEDIRSYKKVIPALKEFPNAFIVTVDDDTYYWNSWLRELIENYQTDKSEIIGHRGHLIRCSSSGQLLPYNNWVYEGALSHPSPLNFLTGVGGVMYPPNVLHEDVKNQKLFMELCPHADDVWLYWMARIKGTDIRRVKAKKRYFYFWPNTLQSGLASNNVFNNGNDQQINKLNSYYKLF